MFVQHISQFLDGIQNCKNNIPFDTQLIKSINNINIHDVFYWKNQLSLRWVTIKDTPNSYVHDYKSHNSMLWIQLSYHISLQLLNTVSSQDSVETLIEFSSVTEDWQNILMPQDASNTVYDFPREKFYIDLNNRVHCLEHDVLNLEYDRPLASSMLFDIQLPSQWQILTLPELKILREQKTPITYKGQNYSTYWSCLQQEILAKEFYTENATYPHHLLPALMLVLEEYIEMTYEMYRYDESLIPAGLLQFSQYLQQCSPQVILFLYNRSFIYNDVKYFYLDVMLDLLGENYSELINIVFFFAKSIYMIDPSITCNRLKLLYYEKISRESVKNLTVAVQIGLNLLNTDGCEELKVNIQRLLNAINYSLPYAISTGIKDLIKDLYAQREYIFRHSSSAINMTYNDFHATWIDFARFLSGAKLLYTNYFSLLIPQKPLNFANLLYLREQRGFLYFDVMSNTFENFCIYLNRSMAIPATNYAVIPRMMIVELCELLEIYSHYIEQHTDIETLLKKLNFIDLSMQQYSIDDINLFNVIHINVCSENLYLIDILLDLYVYTKENNVINLMSMQAKMQGIARWVAQYDYSFVVRQALYSTCYKELSICSDFGIKELLKALLELRDQSHQTFLAELLYYHNSPQEVQYHTDKVQSFYDELDNLIKFISEQESINYLVLNQLRMLYKKREILASHTKFAYNGNCSPESLAWLRLAQKIASLGVFTNNYLICITDLNIQKDQDLVPRTIYVQHEANNLRYRVLNPSNQIVEGILLEGEWPEDLNVDNLLQRIADEGHVYHPNYYGFVLPRLKYMQDQIYSLPIYFWDLSHCALNTTSTELIMLASCELYYNIAGVSNLGEELVQIQNKTHKYPVRYESFINRSVAPDKDEPLYLETILIVKKYVQSILYFGSYYDLTEDQYYWGHVTFRDAYFNQLTPDERERLDNQWIVRAGHRSTFKKMFMDSIDPDTLLCLSCVAMENAQLVYDYLPSIFDNQFKRFYLTIANSQHNLLPKKRCQDHELFVLRLKMLFVLLMSYNERNYFSVYCSLTFLDCYVGSTFFEMVEIYKLIYPMLQSGDFSAASDVYGKIMHAIVADAIKTRSLFFYIWEYPVYKWLQDVQKTEVFNTNLWYEPVFFLERLLPIAMTYSSALIYNFLDEIIRTQIQVDDVEQIKVRVNIKFQKLCQSLPKNHLAAVLDRINYELCEVQNLEELLPETQKLYVTLDEKKILFSALNTKQQVVRKEYLRKELMFLNSSYLTAEVISNYKSIIIDQLFVLDTYQAQQIYLDFIIYRLKSLSTISSKKADLVNNHNSVYSLFNNNYNKISDYLDEVKIILPQDDVPSFEYIAKLQNPIVAESVDDSVWRRILPGHRANTF